MTTTILRLMGLMNKLALAWVLVCGIAFGEGSAQTDSPAAQAAPALGTVEHPARVNIVGSPKFDPALPVVSPPRPLNQPAPEYPDEARRKKLSTIVTVAMVVDETGVPRRVMVVTPAGHGFDQAAIAAVKKWRFKPAMIEGKPVAVEIKSEVDFRTY